MPGAGLHVPGAAAPHRDAAAWAGQRGRGLLCGRGWPWAPMEKPGHTCSCRSPRTGPAGRGLAVMTRTPEHTGLGACAACRGRQGAWPVASWSWWHVRGPLPATPTCSPRKGDRPKHAGASARASPAAVRGSPALPVLASRDPAGRRSPTHLRNAARSPQRGRGNGTTPWAVGVCALPPPATAHEAERAREGRSG